MYSQSSFNIDNIFKNKNDKRIVIMSYVFKDH